MKKLISVVPLIILLNLFLAFGQNRIIHYVNFENPPWVLGCDTLGTQTDMNICSWAAYQKADSVLEIICQDFIKFLEFRIKTETDKYQLNVQKRQKAKLISSMKEFKKLRDNLSDVNAFEFEGGSIRPLIYNVTALEITVNQIKFLTNLFSNITKHYE